MAEDTLNQNLPHIPFYTGDWSKNPEVRAASKHDKGIWVDLIFILWECAERGYLVKPSGKPYSNEEVARMLSISVDEWLKFLECELHRTTPEGIIYSSWIVKHEKKRQVKSDNGKQGGRGNKKARSKLNQSKHKARSKLNPDNDIDNDIDNERNILFDKVWKTYPNKTGKPASKKKWDDEKLWNEADKILKDIELKKRYKWNMKGSEDSRKPPPPNGSTYFNQFRWRDGFEPLGDEKPEYKDPAEIKLKEKLIQLRLDISSASSDKQHAEKMMNLQISNDNMESADLFRQQLAEADERHKKLMTDYKGTKTRYDKIRAKYETEQT